jgi:hypothetical protein
MAITKQTAVVRRAPQHTCKQCERTWNGEEEIADHFYHNQAGPDAPYDSYCKQCLSVYNVARNALGGLPDAAKMIRDEYGAGLLRIWYAAGLQPVQLGHLISEDYLRTHSHT